MWKTILNGPVWTNVLKQFEIYLDNKNPPHTPQDLQTRKELSCLVNEIVELLMGS